MFFSFRFHLKTYLICIMGIVTESTSRLNTSQLPFGVKLKQHQQALLYDMLLTEKNIFGKLTAFGLLSDKPGSGKTYVVLALIYIANKLIFSSQKARGAMVNNLVVIPFHIFSQWEQSINTIFEPGRSGVRVLTVGSYDQTSELLLNPSVLFDYDLVLVTSLYYESVALALNAGKLRVYRLIVDEADAMKELFKTAINVEMTWLVSASIEKMFDEDNDVMKFGDMQLRLSTLRQYQCCSDPEFVDRCMQLPEVQERVVECDSWYTDDMLVHVAKERKSSINALDFSFIPSDQITTCEYKASIGFYKGVQATMAQSEERLKDVEAGLRKIFDMKHQHVLQKTKKELEDVIKTCKNKLDFIHRFTKEKELCHTCLSMLHSGECTFKDTVKTKLESIKEIILNLTQNERKKIMIFSGFAALFRELSAFFTEKKITCAHLDGGTIKQSDRIIESFKEGKMQILLASNTLHACGVNLESITDIVLIHKLDPVVERQVIGRAQRLGRTCPLVVWRLLYENERL